MVKGRLVYFIVAGDHSKCEAQGLQRTDAGEGWKAAT